MRAEQTDSTVGTSQMSGQSAVDLPDSQEKGSTKRTANLISLTALGVGAVISGDFFGWNFGLERGGFGGLIIATLLVGLMYVCVSLSLAELAAMYPSAEGAFKFSRHALGPYAGFCCGLSESLEYVLLVPVIITGLGDQLNVLFGITEPAAQIGWWILLCIFFAILHLWGPKTTFLSNVIITGCSLFTLFLYWCVCISMIDGNELTDRIYNMPPDSNYSDSTKFLPKGGYGVFTSLVFAAWFFIAVEELPLAGEDAINPTRDIPRALIGSIVILMVTAFVTAFFSVSVPGGSFNIASTGAPLSRALIAGLMDNCVNLNAPALGSDMAKDDCDNNQLMNCEYNADEGTCWDSSLSKSALAWEIVINLGTLIGLLNSCHAIIFAGGRQLMSLTRNGIFPPFTKFDVCKADGTPWVALLVDIILSFLISLIVYLIGEGVDFLVGLSVAAACVSYILSMISYIVLKKSKPDNDEYSRPYKSPLNVIGAGYAAILALLIGISFFVDIGVGLGAVITVVVLIVFILIYGLLSIDYKWGCCGKLSGKQRYDEYENKDNNKYQDKSKNIEIQTQNYNDNTKQDQPGNNNAENMSFQD